MPVVINVPHPGVPVSTSMTGVGGVPTVAEMHKRLYRVEQAIQIISDHQQSKRQAKRDAEFDPSRPLLAQDSLMSPIERTRRKMAENAREMRRIIQIQDDHYRGAR